MLLAISGELIAMNDTSNVLAQPSFRVRLRLTIRTVDGPGAGETASLFLKYSVLALRGQGLELDRQVEGGLTGARDARRVRGVSADVATFQYQKPPLVLPRRWQPATNVRL
jgi:hypothetical protein